MPGREDIRRPHAKFGARQVASRRRNDGYNQYSGVDAARGRRPQFSVLAQRPGSSTHASRTSRWIQACILVPSDDRSSHGCRTVIPTDVSTRVQTPAAAPMHGSSWTCPESWAASRCVSATFVPSRNPSDRTGSSGLLLLGPNPVGAAESTLEWGAQSGVSVGDADRAGSRGEHHGYASSCSYTGQPKPAIDCAGQTGC